MQMNTEQPTEIVESLPEAPKPKRSKKAAGKRNAEKTASVVETSPKKPARKPVKPKTNKAAKPGPKKVVAAKVKKTAGRTPGSKKQVVEKLERAVAAKAKNSPGRKPGRKPGKKATALVPAVVSKKRGPKGTGLVGRKADLLQMGESAFLYSLDLQRRIEEMERVVANYERAFEAVRRLFGREMEEIEELVAGLLE
jgi:hypothetical protein